MDSDDNFGRKNLVAALVEDHEIVAANVFPVMKNERFSS